MARAKSPPSPLRGLAHIVWRAPLVAVGFALFFGTIFGAHLETYLRSFWYSIYFTYLGFLAMWVLEQFVLPRLPPTTDARWDTVRISLMYACACMAGAFLAAFLLHITIAPGFLGNWRSAAGVLMFTLLFGALGMGVALSVKFYRSAIDRAKSEEELQVARRIQRSFLLSHFPSMPRLEVHAVNVSSKQVSGDFYDVVSAGEDAFLLAIADVAGKGVPAALLSSMLQASLRTQANTIPSVSSILRNINALVYRSTAVHQFATFFLARVEEDTLRMSYSNAGHNYPMVFRRGGERVALERGGTVVGIMESAQFEEGAVTLDPGDRVVFYTDGISEAANEGGELFGEERLCQLVGSLPPALSAHEATERILEGVRGFLAGVEAEDDMTLMVLRVLEPGEARASSDGGSAPGVPHARPVPAPASRPST